LEQVIVIEKKEVPF